PFAGVGSVRADVGSSTWLGSGTPISRWHVLTAGHVVDINDDGSADEDADHYSFNLNFGSDYSSTHTASAVSVHPHFTGFNNPSVNDDLAILTLSNPIPEEVPIYDLWRTPLSTPGQTVALVGYGRSGDGVNGYTTDASWTIKRLGYNNVDDSDPDDEGSGAAEVWEADFDGPTDKTNRIGETTLGNDLETTLGGGDSGGPGFILDGDQYFLATVNTFTFRFHPRFKTPKFGSGLGGILVPAYTDWIDSVLAELLPLPGDVDGDGWVSDADLSIVIDNWGQSELGRAFGDLNDNGVVDGPDYSEVLSYWNPPSEPPAEAIPEPATLLLLALGGSALLKPKRKSA
ncbi:MAG: trypsin-like serine protease, partial [Phycisphaerae bacterium]|nr:trypsin-like serine protease [Phycisphaerae bacterium]